MPTIHGDLVHLPGFKVPKGPGKAKRAFTAARGKAQGTGSKTRTKVNNVGGAKRSENMSEGRKMGHKEWTDDRTDDAISLANNSAIGGYAAALAGAGVGGAVGTKYGNHKYPEAKRFKQTAGVSKSRAHLITDVGTAAGKMPRRWPTAPRKSLMYGSLGAGAGLGFVGGESTQEKKAKYVKRQERKKLQVTKSYEKLPAYKKPDKGTKFGFSDMGARARQQNRMKQNFKFSGPHGEENKKIQRNAVGGGAAIGGGLGAGVAHAGSMSRMAQGGPKITRGGKNVLIAGGALIGAGYGSATGSVRRSLRSSKRSIAEGHRSGDLKQGKKFDHYGVVQKSSTSAFGVDHG